jgi:hypothetical protein
MCLHVWAVLEMRNLLVVAVTRPWLQLQLLLQLLLPWIGKEEELHLAGDVDKAVVAMAKVAVVMSLIGGHSPRHRRIQKILKYFHVKCAK